MSALSDADIDAATVWTARKMILEIVSMLGGCKETLAILAAMEKLREARDLLKAVRNE